MYAARPYLLLAVMAVIVGVVTSAAPAIWMAAAATACMVLNSSASLVDPDGAKTEQRVRERFAQGANSEEALQAVFEDRGLVLIRICELGSIMLAAGSAIALGIAYGWLPAFGIIVVFLGYGLLRDTEGAKARRRAMAARRTVCGLVEHHLAGTITREQMLARSCLALNSGLASPVRAIPAYYEPVISAQGLTAAQHRTLLLVLEAYLGTTEGSLYRKSEMYETVRGLLGRSQQP